MKKNLGKWFLSSLGIVSTAFSLILLFYSSAYATCTVTQTCNPGGSVSCSGIDGGCRNSYSSVSCRQNNGTTIHCVCGRPCTTSSSGGGGGGIEPELPEEF